MPIDIGRALQVNGWMEPIELEYLARAASKSKHIVEIGSWAGRSATVIAGHTPGFLWCVDTWEKSLVHHDGAMLESALFAEFLRNTAGLPIVPVMTDSLTAAKWMGEAGMTFDMIFIDGDHQASGIRADILAWRPLLAKKGILCGHDYDNAGWPDVKPVVDELVPKFRVIQSIWTTEE